ncbi:LDCC motif putative metal-binding protein [Anaerococcus hydrogenalis]|nr:LDCC motif putative metal-binding protein [Anaerococcus hydrogenalis]
MKIFKAIKNRWNKFLKKLAEENKKSFGDQKLDCCTMNKKEYK